MPEDITIVSARNAGVKDNVHGGQLTKWYLVVRKADGTTVADVYSQRKPENDFAPEQTVYGRIEDGDYGPRLYLEQREDGTPGAPSVPTYGITTMENKGHLATMSKDDYWRRKDERDVASQARMGRAHAQEMSIRAHELLGIKDRPIKDSLVEMADFFQQDVLRFPLADGGGGADARSESRSSASPSPTTDPGGGAAPSGNARADEGVATPSSPSPSAEASPAQKGKLTTLFGQAGLAKDAQKAIVYFRCKQEKATKDGASLLIKDLLEGATAEQLFAEIGDAAGAGDKLAEEAVKMLPANAPVEEVLDFTSAEGKDDDSLPF